MSNRQGFGLDDRVVLLNLAAETFVEVVEDFALILWALLEQDDLGLHG